MTVATAQHPAQLNQTNDLAPHRFTWQTGRSSNRIRIAGFEHALLFRFGTVLRSQPTDIVQRNLAKQDGQQDVTVELFKPATDITDFVAGKQQGDLPDCTLTLGRALCFGNRFGRLLMTGFGAVLC